MGLFEGLRVFGLGSVALRLVCAVLCGAMVGIDREMRNKKAGLKTHVLVCLGAALCMVVSECIVLGRAEITTDATRIAANVVTGVGFLCASTLFTRRNGSQHGLTTAAGLWTTAGIGLACGCGWVEVGIMAATMVLIVFFVFGRLDDYITGISRGFDLYVELDDFAHVPAFFDELRARHVQFSDLEITKSPIGNAIVRLAAMTAHLGEKQQVVGDLRNLDYVCFLELV